MDPGNSLHNQISYDQLVLAPILSQMIESFAEIADLVGFIVWVVHKCNFKLLVGARFKLDDKAVGSNMLVLRNLDERMSLSKRCQAPQYRNIER